MYKTTFGAGPRPSTGNRARSVSPLRPSTSPNPSTKDRARPVSPLRPSTSLGSPEGTRAKQLKTLTSSIDACLLETEDITQSPRYQEASRIALNLIELCSDPVIFFAGKTRQRAHETEWKKFTKDFTSKIGQLIAIAERYDTPEKTAVAKKHILKLAVRVNANIKRSAMSPRYKFGFDNKTRKFVPERIPQSHLLEDASAHTSSPLSLTTLLRSVRFENEQTVKDTITVFLEAGGDLNDSNIYGDTPLHVAAQYGNLDAVRVLLDAKANPNIKNKTGFTPLDKAIHAGHKDVCRLLLSDKPSITLNVHPDDWARVHKIG